MAITEITNTLRRSQRRHARDLAEDGVMDSDVIGFAQISGDHKPIHLSEHFAARTKFGGRIAHGLYTASLISPFSACACRVGAIYLSQTLNFKAPVRIGDVIEVSVEVVELIERGARARLACEARVDAAVVLEGEAIVKVPRRAEMDAIGRE